MSTHIYSSIGLQKYILKEDRISAEYILEYMIKEDRIRAEYILEYMIEEVYS